MSITKLCSIIAVSCSIACAYSDTQNISIDLLPNNQYSLQYNDQSRLFGNTEEFNSGINDFTNGNFDANITLENNKMLFSIEYNKNNNTYNLLLNNLSNQYYHLILNGGNNKINLNTEKFETVAITDSMLLEQSEINCH